MNNEFNLINLIKNPFIDKNGYFIFYTNRVFLYYLDITNFDDEGKENHYITLSNTKWSPEQKLCKLWNKSYIKIKLTPKNNNYVKRELSYREIKVTPFKKLNSDTIVYKID